MTRVCLPVSSDIVRLVADFRWNLASRCVCRGRLFHPWGQGTMLGAINRRIFGPSRAETRAAVVSYLEQLRENIPGEAFDVVDVGRDYEHFRHERGLPELDVRAILGELDALGVRQFVAIRVPWAPNGSNGSPPPAMLPKPEPIEDPEPAPQPEPLKVSKPRTVRAKAAHGSSTQDEALADVRARLARGETMPSQKFLADAWGMSESRVCEWFAIWRAARLVPPAKREGICNVIQMPRVKRVA